MLTVDHKQCRSSGRKAAQTPVTSVYRTQTGTDRICRLPKETGRRTNQNRAPVSYVR